MGSDMITPSLPVAIVKTLEPIQLVIDKIDSTEKLEINLPGDQNNEATSVNIRILSAEFRQGMVINLNTAATLFFAFCFAFLRKTWINHFKISVLVYQKVQI